eukprot:437595-Amphidinium_carterae.1
MQYTCSEVRNGVKHVLGLNPAACGGRGDNGVRSQARAVMVKDFVIPTTIPEACCEELTLKRKVLQDHADTTLSPALP